MNIYIIHHVKEDWEKGNSSIIDFITIDENKAKEFLDKRKILSSLNYKFDIKNIKIDENEIIKGE